jgi:hypothetical protein
MSYKLMQRQLYHCLRGPNNGHVEYEAWSTMLGKEHVANTNWLPVTIWTAGDARVSQWKQPRVTFIG